MALTWYRQNYRGNSRIFLEPPEYIYDFLKPQHQQTVILILEKLCRYEQNRAQRKVQEVWRTGRPWLTLDHTNNCMDCSWCHQRWTTAKLETLKSHEMSKVHIKNRDIIAGELKLCFIVGSSSECERGFRQMKSIKTTFRSCLCEDSLSSQMCIKLHSPSIQE